MFIRIETTSGVPITRQIIDQIRAQYASGGLAPGDRLPSVRQLARDLAVNQNTILKVYERLTAEGLIERHHGDGTYIAEKPVTGQLEVEREKLKEEAGHLARHALTLGANQEELIKLIRNAYGAAKQEKSR